MQEPEFTDMIERLKKIIFKSRHQHHHIFKYQLSISLFFGASQVKNLGFMSDKTNKFIPTELEFSMYFFSSCVSSLIVVPVPNMKKGFSKSNFLSSFTSKKSNFNSSIFVWAVH